MTADVILHLAKPDLAGYRGKESAGIYPAIWDVLHPRGARLRIAERSAEHMQGRPLEGDGNLHIVETGFCSGPGWFCAATAYLPGFWHLSDRGVLADSPAREATFDPVQVPWKLAKQFDRDLRNRFVSTRVSRYRQEKLPTEILPEGALAVFLQGPAVYRRHQAFVSAKEMLRAIAQSADGRDVVVKAHPLAKPLGQEVIAAVRAEGFDLIETHANVHDILASCAATLSVNSAVALEGFLHRKPAILFGRSDFHHLAETVVRLSDLPSTLDRALSRDWDFAKMLYWYFSAHSLQVAAPTFPERLLQLFGKAGFGPDRLGLSGQG